MTVGTLKFPSFLVFYACWQVCKSDLLEFWRPFNSLISFPCAEHISDENVELAMQSLDANNDEKVSFEVNTKQHSWISHYGLTSVPWGW